MAAPDRPSIVSTASTTSFHEPLSAPQSGAPTPSGSPPSTNPGSPLGFQLASLPGSRAVSPLSTPGSSRPPSPLLRAMNNLSMQNATEPPPKTRRGSVGDSLGDTLLKRKTSLKSPMPRRGSSPAMAPFLAKFEEMDPNAEIEEKVAVIGSGSWGTALARLAAQNAMEKPGFDETVNFWVREREIPGKGKLTDIINETHENARYLPQMILPENLVAVPSLVECVKGATLIIFCVPHQFLPPVMKELKKPGVLTKGARAISAIKGIEVDLKSIDIYTYPAIIEKELGLPCSALGGANIALEVANEEFCETTIGCPSPKDASLWHAVFDTQMFRVHPVEDVAGVSLSGALKNIIAMAAGFVDGMGMGGNTKAAILRIGLLEMSSFTLEFFPSASPQTFSHHSAGVADLITTSFGGRNRKCAEAFIKTGKTFPELEDELLNGQKLQGTITAQEIYEFLKGRGRLEGYPLFTKVYQISFESLDPQELFSDL
ncbi:NAD-dependent glycerol-3-phosphate dehydrogenase C-terminus-domain-containing protein [Leucosporidium creatinivorum]|uniref:Glycerol-3-phosphate dehydrogenase [NAD(+)] n=1 Tax=Leucosporidium creatinivorum TaxID=106004 RepID=A0A1Y2EWJ7_9BASI|nr:NAD-dependent glycerol-3-phosphate dehydrogenase C-terminus-domain-containing protein [Leucosporidium creatinivorum]